MRILLCGNAFWCNTGYGTQARFIIDCFQKLGHEVFCMPHYGLQGGPIVVDGIQNLPVFRDGWGTDIIGQHVRQAKIDAVLSFHDVWTLSPQFPMSFPDTPWVTYSPVDGAPLQPKLKHILQHANHVLAMSRYGQSVMADAEINSIYLPHAIDTAIYKPGDKIAARKELGLPEDRFIALIVAANYYYPGRKAFPEQLLAFSKFREKRKDAFVVLHTAMYPTGQQGGVDINALIRNLKLGNHSANSEDYDIAMGLPDERMAKIYQAADVLLGASYCEGFGLCQAEAQACGVPVIIHDFAASPEFLYNGLAVPSAQPFWDLGGYWKAIPSIEAITRALEDIYLIKDLPETQERTQRSIANFRQDLSREVVFEKHWKPFIGRLEEDVDSRIPKRSSRRIVRG